MKPEERARWLESSPPIAVDGGDEAELTGHTVRVRDLRFRFGAPEAYPPSAVAVGPVRNNAEQLAKDSPAATRGTTSKPHDPGQL
jgi:hypothetical protein